MARCGCASDRCSCTIVGGNQTSVSGTGTAANPYVVEVTPSNVVGPASDGRFAGEIIAYGGSTSPNGWLLCNGAVYNRTTYAALFATIGTTYGAGDGSTTFAVPNLTGRFPLGTSGTHARGATAGAETVSLTNAHIPSHTHTAGIQSSDHQHSFLAELGTNTATGGTFDRITDINNLTGGTGTDLHPVTTTQNNDHTHAISATPASTTAVPIMPPSLAVQYLIKF